MLFGKINYTNLAPFHIFLKRYIKNSQFKAHINYYKSYPAKINKKFKTRKIDAGFISSVESFRGRFKRYDIGIVANKKVKSVLVKKGSFKKDKESASSNALAKVLSIDGEVIIGDKALKLYLENPSCYQDLCTLWHKKYKTPFVFARFCSNKHHKFYKKMIKNFIYHDKKIPRYILKRYAKKTGLKEKDILDYLKLISYKITPKAQKGLLKFKKLHSRNTRNLPKF
jgi:chorismate dehydratase